MSWPVDTLTIGRFRGLQGLTMEGAGRINLLVGDNNAGKTSVLEALAIHARPLEEEGWIATAQRRVKGFSTTSRAEALMWLFPHGKRPAEDEDNLFTGDLEIAGSGRGGRRELSAHLEEFEALGGPMTAYRANLEAAARLLGEREGADKPERGVTLGLALTTGSGVERRTFKIWDTPEVRPQRSPREPSSIPVKILAPFDHGVEGLYLENFRQAVLRDYRPLVIEALTRVDPGIQELEVLPSGFRAELYLRHARSGRTPVSAFGDGVRRVLLMALSLPLAAGGYLLIDEIETAVHVSVLGGVFKWLVGACKAYDVQLFATTHSLEALDAVLAAGTDDLGEIVAYRFPAPEQPGPPKRYAGDQLHRLRYERGLDVR